MTTTYIRFNEKQDFETIKTVIEEEFTNVQTHNKISDLDYISFDYKGQNIFCWFMKHNQIYGKGHVLTECSSFSSDRPNEIKTEAFKIIAKYFDCRFWQNDCEEDDYIDFKKTNMEYLTIEQRTQAIKNIQNSFLTALRCNGFEISDNALCNINKSSIILGIDDFTLRGKIAFASYIEIYAKEDSDIIKSRNKINFGSSGSFDPTNIESYWRTIHAASLLKNWDVACNIVNKHCEMYSNLAKEISKQNNIQP